MVRKLTVLQLVLTVAIFIISSCRQAILPGGLQSPAPTTTWSPATTIPEAPDPTSTHVLPVVNTATVQERERFVRESLSDNNNCRLPCWWGFIPGETAWTDVEEVLLYLGVKIGSVPGSEPNTIFHGTGGFDFIDVTGKSIFSNVSFSEKEGLVYTIHITSEGYNNPTEFHRLWQDYSPQKIVMTYGMPDRILLNVVDPYSVYGGYYLWFFYDKLGFSIRYPGNFEVEPVLRICSSIETIGKIDLNLQTSENELPLDRFDPLLEEKRLGTETGRLRVVQSLQDATGLDDTEIYNTFIRDDEACFDTPQEIWGAQ
jgi:hypothetical protein